MVPTCLFVEKLYISVRVYYLIPSLLITPSSKRTVVTKEPIPQEILHEWFAPGVAPIIPHSLPIGKRGRGKCSNPLLPTPLSRRGLLTLLHYKALTASSCSSSNAGEANEPDGESYIKDSDDEVQVVDVPKQCPRPVKRIRTKIGV